MEKNIYSIAKSWNVEFVKKQDEFIKEKCIEHIKDTNKRIRIFKIDEDKLDYIFNLGLDIFKAKFSRKEGLRWKNIM